jgi:hypothetical protein
MEMILELMNASFGGWRPNVLRVWYTAARDQVTLKIARHTIGPTYHKQGYPECVVVRFENGWSSLRKEIWVAERGDPNKRSTS